MSHFTEVKTKLKEKSLILKALKQLGFETEDAATGVDVRGFFGDTQKADFKALTSTHYDIGFRQTQDGSYECVADWELMPQVADIYRDDFMSTLKREYAKAAVLQLAEEKGYEVSINTDEQSGSIEMVVSQW